MAEAGAAGAARRPFRVAVLEIGAGARVTTIRAHAPSGSRAADAGQSGGCNGRVTDVTVV